MSTAHSDKCLCSTCNEGTSCSFVQTGASAAQSSCAIASSWDHLASISWHSLHSWYFSGSMLQTENDPLPFEWPVCQEYPLPPIPSSADHPSRCLQAAPDKPYAIIGYRLHAWKDLVKQLQVARNVDGTPAALNLLINTDIFLYQAKNKEAPYFYYDRGYEVGAVLQFIVDHYDCLPQVIISPEQQQFSCSLTHSYVDLIAI